MSTIPWELSELIRSYRDLERLLSMAESELLHQWLLALTEIVHNVPAVDAVVLSNNIKDGVLHVGIGWRRQILVNGKPVSLTPGEIAVIIRDAVANSAGDQTAIAGDVILNADHDFYRVDLVVPFLTPQELRHA